MKILQISTGFDIGFNGGITNYVRNLSETLIDLTIETIVLDSTEEKIQNNYKFKRKKLNDLKLKPFNLKSVIKNTDSDKVIKLIDEIKPDIVHIHMMLDLPLEIIEKIQGKYKTILSLHDYSWFCNRISLQDIDGHNCNDSNKGESCKKCINKLVLNRYTNYLINRSKIFKEISKKFLNENPQKKINYMKKIFNKFDCVIAVSNRVKEIYEKNEFKNKNFIVNHIGNITAEKSFRDKFIKNKNITKANKDYIIGFIGNFCKIKGSNLILELSQIIENKIYIFGRISEEDLKIIKTIKNIEYKGGYIQKELDKVLSQIDIGLVFPIWEDNAPQVVFEMQNALIPIIGTRMGGIPDFVKEEENGILIEPDLEGLKKVKLFLSKENLSEILEKYKNNLKRGTKTPQEHCEEMLNIYKGLLNNEEFKK